MLYEIRYEGTTVKTDNYEDWLRKYRKALFKKYTKKFPEHRVKIIEEDRRKTFEHEMKIQKLVSEKYPHLTYNLYTTIKLPTISVYKCGEIIGEHDTSYKITLGSYRYYAVISQPYGNLISELSDTFNQEIGQISDQETAYDFSKIPSQYQNDIFYILTELMDCGIYFEDIQPEFFALSMDKEHVIVTDFTHSLYEQGTVF